MRYLSVCSGIEAATVAWHPLGWQPVAFAEIDPFASALLAHYYPDVPNLGDMTTITDDVLASLGRIDLVVGGTPCQDLSIAGRRGGLDAERSGLFHEFARIFDAARRLCGARWAVWENVPGAFSTNAGRDFAVVVSTLAGLDELAPPVGGWRSEGLALGPHGLVEWSVLDAQWFGLAQRRERVFVVVDSGNWRDRPPVLLEPESLRGDSPPRREAGAAVARCVTRGSDSGQRYDGETETFVTHTLRAEGFDASEDGTGRGIPLVSSTLRANSGRNQIEATYVAAPLTTKPYADNEAQESRLVACFDETQITHPENRSLARPETAALARSARPPAVAFDMRGREGGAQFEGPHDTANIRASSGGSSRSYVVSAAVRRLTPRECERLMGVPDDYTLIPYRGKPASDSARYKALGNSMAVPCMSWIGQRIQAVQRIFDGEKS